MCAVKESDHIYYLQYIYLILVEHRVLKHVSKNYTCTVQAITIG